VNQDAAYLQHIRDALLDIKTYRSPGQEVFMRERMLQDAVLRKLEIIGQAVKNLSEKAKASQPQIPWKQIAGMLDKIHDYFGVNLDIVWRW